MNNNNNNNNNNKSEGKKYLRIVASVFLVFVLFTLIIGNFDYFSYNRSITKSKSWKNRFKVNEIKTIAIKLDSNTINASSEINIRFWKEVRNVYVNNQEIQASELYKKEDFIYSHCNENYVLLTKKEIDSIVYKFPPINQYEEYVNGKLINKLDVFSSKRKTHKKYNTSLPKCKE